MWPGAQAIDDQDVEALKLGPAGGGDVAAVCAVGEIPDAKALHREPAVGQVDGFPGFAKKLKGALDVHRGKLRPKERILDVLRRQGDGNKRVRKDLSQRLHG